VRLIHVAMTCLDDGLMLTVGIRLGNPSFVAELDSSDLFWQVVG
jgi:hypothetical protein